MSREKVGEFLSRTLGGDTWGGLHRNKSLVGYQSPLTSHLLTPPKSNMEPWKGINIYKPPIVGFYVTFRECIHVYVFVMYNRCFLFTLLFCRLLWPCEAIRQQRLTDRQIHGSLPRDGAFGRWEDRCVGQNLRMLRQRYIYSRQIPLKYVSR